MKRVQFLIIVISVIILLQLPLLGQSGTMQGVVKDSTGAVIPGAEVVITNVETGVTTNSISNDVGFYTVPSLNPGRYNLTCTVPGFAPSERQNLRLEVAQVMRVDFNLNVGTVSEVVEVSAATTLLQSEKTDVGQVIDSKRILEMPLNGRNYLQLAQFSVGVLPSRDQGKGTRQDGEQGGEGGFLAAGMHAAQNNILLDGMDNSSRNSGGPLGFQSQAVKPPVDAVQEFKVVTNNVGAEYGYRTGAKVIVSTKSGTNELHGSVYWFVRNDAFDGTNFFANRSGAEKPHFRQNQYGLTLGGPIIKNKMFAFFSWQGTRIRLGRSFTSSVPSLDAINGDFSQQPSTERDIFDPATYDSATGKRQPFPGNIIPADRIDPVSKAVAELYPAPNIAGREHLRNNFFYSPVQTNDFDQYDFRWDYVVNDNHQVFARYSVRNQNEDQPGPLPFPAVGGTGQTIKLDGDSISTALSSSFGTNKFNELRVGYTHFPTRFDIPFTENYNTKLGIKGAPGDTMNDGLDHGMALFIPGGGFAQVGPRGFWPNNNNLYNWLISDSFTLVRGNHIFKMGGEFRRTETYRMASRHRRGRFTFNGDYTTEEPNSSASRAATGVGLADMLLGLAQNANFGFPQGENHFVSYWAGFFQDDWKITNRLTLNLGLRWELFTAPVFDNPQEQTVARFLTEINGRETMQGEREMVGEDFLPYMVFPQDGSDSGAKLDKNNFAPRLGLAFQMFDKTVLRVGAGLFYGEADNTQTETARFLTGAPRAIELTAPQGRTSTDLIVQEGFPVIPDGAWPAGTNVKTSHDFLPTFYAAQWFMDLQHELPYDILLTIGYNGTSASFLYTNLNINHPYEPHPTIRWQNRKRWNFFNAVNRGEAMLNSNYNSLTVKAEKRFGQGFTFLNSFTWAHNIDYANENLQQGGGSRLFTWNLGLDRGNSSLDRRLSNVTSFFYELPFGSGKRWLNSGPAAWILGNWQVGGILQLLNGTWDHHTINQNTTNVGGANRGDLLRNPNLPTSQRSIDRWFDTEAVVAGKPGELDNAGRNLIEGPGRKNIDFILAKTFPMPWEGHQLQFRAEAFNLTNTPHWGRPNRGFGGSAVGTITSCDEPRRIQFGLKYVF
jgi:hypothetical protein